MEEILKGMINDIFGAGAANGIIDSLTLDFTGSWAKTISSVMDTYLTPLGLALVLIFFLTDLIDHTQFQQATPEYLIKSLVKLLISMYLVANCATIFGDLNGAFIKFTKDINTSIGTVAISTDTGAVATLHNKISKSTIVEQIGYLVWILVAWIAVLLTDLAINFTLYSRIFKLYVMATFSPIGVADTISGGFNSKGIRYIKSFIALCLQGAIIVMIVYASNILLPLITSAEKVGVSFSASFLIYHIITRLVIAGSVIKSEQVAKEIIGA